jgi:adenosylcobinamide-GDP ribazoletransferase
MKKELRIFFTALMFYTRIPCPSWVNHAEEYINKATRYFPLMGWIVGGVSAGCIYLLQWILPLPIAVLLGMAAGILVTGAFHEDGFADVCDGFGGGWAKDKILDIMKDSRVGAFGAIGIILLLSLKATALYYLFTNNAVQGIVWAIWAHVASRYIVVQYIYTHNYVREDELSKAKPIAKQLNAQQLLISTVWLLPFIILLPHPLYWVSIGTAFTIKIYLAAYFKKWIGGYTGDCLGATQQLLELTILLTCLVICKYI